MSEASQQPAPHAHVALAARRQRRARWMTGLGLAGAAGLTVALLATAQGSTGGTGSPGAVATVDPAQATVGVAQAGVVAPVIEPPLTTTLPRGSQAP